MSKNITAGIIIMGNEILSGRTRDSNMNFIACELVKMGIRLCEARVVADIEEDIIHAVNEMRRKYTYIFATGGIGPTHDDITAQSVARAFGTKLIEHPEAVKALQEFYDRKNEEFNDARRRMAFVPEGASLIANDVSNAPGFTIENLHVMAGFPKIMQSMFAALKDDLKRGAILHSISVSCNLIEGEIAGPLREIQNEYEDTEIGSYPYRNGEMLCTSIVIRAVDKEMLQSACDAVQIMIDRQGGTILDTGPC